MRFGTGFLRDAALAVLPAQVSNGVLRLSPVAALTYAGGFDDSLGVFALTKLGPHALTLTGSGLNRYSGATTVSNGRIIAGAANVLSPNSALAFTSARASVDLNGYDQTIAGLFGGGTVQNGGGAATLTLGTASFSGSIGGATQVVTTGGGVVSFSGANSYTGGTIVKGGTLRYVDDAAFGTGAIRFAAPSTMVAANPGRNLGNAIMLDADVVAGSDGVSTVLSGVVSGAGSLTKTGRAILALANPSNSFGGGFSLQQGSVAIGGNGSLGTGVFSVGPLQTTLMLTGNFSVVVANPISVGHLLNFELPDAAQSVTLNGLISGAGGLYLKTGAGTLILNGANTYAGVTQLGSGIIGLGNSNALGGGASNFSHGGGTGIAAYAPDIVLANAIRGQDVMTVDTRGYTMTLTGVLSNKYGFVGSIDKIGLGVLTVTGANTYTGTTTVTTGELHLTGSLASDVVVAGGATLSGAGMLAPGRSATIGDGAILSPGFGAAGTFTFGNLRLSGGSVLKFDLTTPAIGGAGNDLIVVSNDLTLDGILRINAQPGFKAGTYRIIDYAGALTNNILVAGDSGIIGAGNRDHGARATLTIGF